MSGEKQKIDSQEKTKGGGQEGAHVFVTYSLRFVQFRFLMFWAIASVFGLSVSNAFFIFWGPPILSVFGLSAEISSGF